MHLHLMTDGIQVSVNFSWYPAWLLLNQAFWLLLPYPPYQGSNTTTTVAGLPRHLHLTVNMQVPTTFACRGLHLQGPRLNHHPHWAHQLALTPIWLRTPLNYCTKLLITLSYLQPIHSLSRYPASTLIALFGFIILVEKLILVRPDNYLSAKIPRNG